MVHPWDCGVLRYREGAVNVKKGRCESSVAAADLDQFRASTMPGWTRCPVIGTMRPGDVWRPVLRSSVMHMLSPGRGRAGAWAAVRRRPVDGIDSWLSRRISHLCLGQDCSCLAHTPEGGRAGGDAGNVPGGDARRECRAPRDRRGVEPREHGLPPHVGLFESARRLAACHRLCLGNHGCGQPCFIRFRLMPTGGSVLSMGTLSRRCFWGPGAESVGAWQLMRRRVVVGGGLRYN